MYELLSRFRSDSILNVSRFSSYIGESCVHPEETKISQYSIIYICPSNQSTETHEVDPTRY